VDEYECHRAGNWLRAMEFDTLRRSVATAPEVRKVAAQLTRAI
jgi:hypothetical protein